MVDIEIASSPPLRQCRRGLRLAALLASVTLFLGLTSRNVNAQAPTEAILEVQKKVVKIFGAGGLRGLAAYGSGFLVSPDGHIVTIWSHVLDADSVTVVLHNGQRFRGKLVGAEPQLDLAVLKIEAEDLSHFDLSKSVTGGPGTRVLAYSNMFKVATGDEPVSVLHGVISAMSNLDARRGRFEVPYHGPVYIVDAITNNPGAAGGVVTNRQGELLGVIGRELRSSETNLWLNYVVPIRELSPVIEQIRSGDFSSAPTTTTEPAIDNPTTLAELGLVLVPDVVTRTPAYVDEVLADSPAAKADLQPDDLIVFVNTAVVHSIQTLQDELSLIPRGTALTLMVRRGGELKSVSLKVVAK